MMRLMMKMLLPRLPPARSGALQTVLAGMTTAGPLEQLVLLLTYPPTAGPLEQLVLLLTMLGAAPPWAVVAAAVVAVPAASCLPTAGSEAPQWAVTEVAAQPGMPSCPPQAGSEALVAASANGWGGHRGVRTCSR